MTISPCAMLMTPITPKVIARPIAASNSTEPSDNPYQAFCTLLHSASRLSIDAMASAAARCTRLGSARPGGPASRPRERLVGPLTDHADRTDLVVLDEHLPVAVDVLADLVSHPIFDPTDIEKEQKVVLEEIKMVEDTPDDLVHELFAEGFWPDHPLGRPILGVPATVSALDQASLRAFFGETYVAPNMSVVAVGNIDHDRLKALLEAALADLPLINVPIAVHPPVVAQNTLVRRKELEQSHVCLGMPALAQNDPDRYVSYALNTVLGGSMSSRLFQNVREKRGLAYAVFSGLSAYQDSGALSIYAGCANEAVSELIDVVVVELRQLRDDHVGDVELRRAKDHLKGSLILNLEGTSSRMSHLARQEIYRDRTDTLDEMLAAIERVTVSDVNRMAQRFFATGSLGITVLGNVNGLQVTRERLAV